MLDDYSLRLLAEIGVDVYLPRSGSALKHDASAQVANLSANTVVDANSTPGASVRSAAVLIVAGNGSDRKKLLQDLVRALRMAGLDAEIADSAHGQTIAAARGLIVLGEPLARSIGADMPAQRQNEITWIVARDAAALAADAGAKRALWGEIKRLSRSLAAARQP